MCKATDHQKLFATTEPKLTCVFLILHRYAWSVKYFELPTVNIFVGEESTKDILFPALMKQQSILLKDCSIKSFSYLCFFFFGVYDDFAVYNGSRHNTLPEFAGARRTFLYVKDSV